MQRRELVRTGLFGVAAAAAGAAHAAQDAAPAKKRLSENWDVVVVEPASPACAPRLKQPNEVQKRSFWKR